MEPTARKLHTMTCPVCAKYMRGEYVCQELKRMYKPSLWKVLGSLAWNLVSVVWVIVCALLFVGGMALCLIH